MSTPLTSWKEIAAYMGRGVRTVQRWEACCGLPVRRPGDGSRSTVLAVAEELDEWTRMGTTVASVGKELAVLRGLVEIQTQEIASLRSEIRRLVSVYLLSDKEVPSGAFEKALTQTVPLSVEASGVPRPSSRHTSASQLV
jgi:hypothetical protein